MNQDDVARMGLYTIPRLCVLVQAKKQVAWQRRTAAGEHKQVWRIVEFHIDSTIKQLERTVKDRLGLDGFRMKREIVE